MPKYRVGACVVAFVTAAVINAGCNLIPKPPRTIAVRDETVPYFIKEGEPAPYEGVLMSKPLFAEFAPCFEDPDWMPSDAKLQPIPQRQETLPTYKGTSTPR